jgi:hypothetical protein
MGTVHTLRSSTEFPPTKKTKRTKKEINAELDKKILQVLKSEPNRMFDIAELADILGEHWRDVTERGYKLHEKGSAYYGEWHTVVVGGVEFTEWEDKQGVGLRSMEGLENE